MLGGCPSSSWAGKAEKSFLASLCLTCGLISGSSWDFWGLSQRCGVSHATHLERGELHPHSWHYLPKASAQCSAIQWDTLHTFQISQKFPKLPNNTSWRAPHSAWALFPLSTQSSTLSWCALSWCSEQRLNKEKWEAFNASFYHLWSLGEDWVAALVHISGLWYWHSFWGSYPFTLS